MLLWETVLELADERDPIVFIARDKSAFFSKDGTGVLSGALKREVETRDQQAVVKLHSEAAEAIVEALEISAELAEQEQQAALAEQRAANQAALNALNHLLVNDHGFAALLADAVDDALRFWDLGPDLRPFGVEDGDVYGAHIDIVESLHNWRFGSAHVAEDGLVLSEVSAEVRANAIVVLHPSTATLLDDNPRVRISDFGYGTARAEGDVDITARVVCDVVVDIRAAELASLATVSHFEPLDV